MPWQRGVVSGSDMPSGGLGRVGEGGRGDCRARVHLAVSDAGTPGWMNGGTRACGYGQVVVPQIAAGRTRRRTAVSDDVDRLWRGARVRYKGSRERWGQLKSPAARLTCSRSSVS